METNNLADFYHNRKIKSESDFAIPDCNPLIPQNKTYTNFKQYITLGTSKQLKSLSGLNLKVSSTLGAGNSCCDSTSNQSSLQPK